MVPLAEKHSLKSTMTCIFPVVFVFYMLTFPVCVLHFLRSFLKGACNRPMKKESKAKEKLGQTEKDGYDQVCM